MKTKPILFSGPMVRAILDGRKTMTRRVVKDQHLMVGAPRSFEAYSFDDCECGGFGFASEDDVWKSPYGQPGDLLWVRETWTADLSNDELRAKLEDVYQDRSYGPFYKATEEDPDIFPRWKPSIHMPRWASRLTLKVTGVRVERLQDISEADANAEGPPAFDSNGDLYYSAKDAFWGLWQSINGKPRANGQDISWDANPWVWVVEFEPIHMNIDQYIKENT